MTEPENELTISAEVLSRLHRIHRQLSDLRGRLRRGPVQVQAREKHLQQLQQQLEQLRQQTKTAQVAADHKQLQLRSGEEKIAKLRKQLQEAKSNKEYQLLLEQIKADEMANSVLETEILEALEKIDALKRKVHEVQAQVEKVQEDLQRVRAQVQEEQHIIQEDIQRLEQELVQVETFLPEQFRERYQRVVRAKGSDGMALVDSGMCCGCYHELPPNQVNLLMMQRIVFCPSCGRLLYMEQKSS